MRCSWHERVSGLSNPSFEIPRLPSDVFPEAEQTLRTGALAKGNAVQKHQPTDSRAPSLFGEPGQR